MPGFDPIYAGGTELVVNTIVDGARFTLSRNGLLVGTFACWGGRCMVGLNPPFQAGETFSATQELCPADGPGNCCTRYTASPHWPRRWLLSTHQGSVDEAHLQSYLDEFVFRFNRRRSRSRGLVFYRVLQLAVGRAWVRYRNIVAGKRPQKIPPTPPAARGHPPSLERPPAERPWRAAYLDYSGYCNGNPRNEIIRLGAREARPGD